MNPNFVCCYVTYPTGQGATTRRDQATTNRTTRRTAPGGHRWARKRLNAPRRGDGSNVTYQGRTRAGDGAPRRGKARPPQTVTGPQQHPLHVEVREISRSIQNPQDRLRSQVPQHLMPAHRRMHIVRRQEHVASAVLSHRPSVPSTRQRPCDTPPVHTR